MYANSDNWDKFPVMENSTVKYVLGAMARLLRPLVKMLIERGISYDQAADVLRKTYCDVAFGEEFVLPGRKQTDSRVSVLTGLTRKDVARLKEMSLESPGFMNNYNRAIRVVTGWWLAYPQEGTTSGAAPLPIDGDTRSFAEIVKRYSGDMPVRAVLDELLRTGAVNLRDDGLVELVTQRYIPEPGEINRIEYLGNDVGELISTIAHNLKTGVGDARVQRKVYFDNVPTEHVEAIHSIVKTLAVHALDSAKREMSRFDRDMNSEITGSGRNRVTFGVYFSEENVEHEVTPIASATETKQ